MLKVICDFSDYKPWSGAVSTYDKIEDANKLDELEEYLEELYPEGIDMTKINDILWFDGESVLADLGIKDLPESIEAKLFEIDIDLEDEDIKEEDIKEAIEDYLEDEFDEVPTTFKYTINKENEVVEINEIIW